MALAKISEILGEAQKGGYAVTAFDCFNFETINLAIDVQEDTEIYTPLTSRIAHLVVIAVLAMGVAMSRGPTLVNHLKSVKRSLRSLRLSPKSAKQQED